MGARWDGEQSIEEALQAGRPLAAPKVNGRKVIVIVLIAVAASVGGWRYVVWQVGETCRAWNEAMDLHHALPPEVRMFSEDPTDERPEGCERI